MSRDLHLSLAAVLAAAACTAMPPTNELMPHRAPTPAGTSTAPARAGTAPSTIDPPALPLDGFVTLKAPADAHAELCAADGMHPRFPEDADLVTKTFCQDLVPGGVMPTPQSLADLQKQLGLDFKDPRGGNGVGGNPGFAILGHSSALTARKVSTIAPTAFVFTPPPADGTPPVGPYVVLGFDPGEQFAEIASYDATVKNMNFYLVLFDQACTAAPGGCTTTDLLSPRLVTGWSNVRVYEDTTSLNDTIFDCHVCHQPSTAASPFLRMQEIAPPFTHWFSAQTIGGKALLADFHRARGASEDYGPIPAALVDESDPSLLAALLRQGGFGTQPNAFPSQAVEAEVVASAPEQPSLNVPPGTSATWQALYDAAAAGLFIAPPYHDVKVTDDAKLASMGAAYRAFSSGTSTTLPDIRDVFLDDGLRDMGFAPKAGADGRALLAQMCEECHDANLDMTITREKFLVDRLDTMSRDEKDVAVTRLKADATSRLRMPPPLFRTITEDERAAMVLELQK
jgi:hypothetical protein